MVCLDRAGTCQRRASMMVASSPPSECASHCYRHGLRISAPAHVQDHQDDHDVQHAGHREEHGQPVEQPAGYWLAVIAVGPLAPMWIVWWRWRYVGIAVKCGWYVGAAVRCGRLVARAADGQLHLCHGPLPAP